MRLLHPLPGARVTQRFGENPDWYGPAYTGHEGLDFSAEVGTTVRASHDGTAYTRMSSGYGTYIELIGAGMRTVYAHLSEVLRTGPVKAGDVIALTGDTGHTTGPHLHFGVCPLPRDWTNGYQGYVDPQGWLVEMEESMSKLGVHFQGPPELGSTDYENDATQLVRNSKMKWVKGIDVDRWPSPAREMFPRQQVIGRFWIGGDKLEHAYMARGAQGAEEYFAMLRPRYNKCLAEGCSYFEGPNEPHPTADGNDPAAYEAFELRWAQLVVSIGGKPLVWSIGNGWFARGTAHLFKESIDYASLHGGGLAKHEYGYPSVLSGGGWWTYGTLHILDELYAAGLARGSVRVFITECGETKAAVGGDDVGWKKNTYVFPEGEDGLPLGIMTEERYWRQISAYDDGYANVPEVICILPFTTCPNEDWWTHDFGGTLIRRAVRKYEQEPVTDEEINAALGDIGQQHIVPLNKDAALYKAAIQRNIGAIAVTREIRADGFVFQAYRFPGDPGTQHWFRCAEGDWQNVTYWTRAN